MAFTIFEKTIVLKAAQERLSFYLQQRREQIGTLDPAKLATGICFIEDDTPPKWYWPWRRRQPRQHLIRTAPHKLADVGASIYLATNLIRMATQSIGPISLDEKEVGFLFPDEIDASLIGWPKPEPAVEVYPPELTRSAADLLQAARLVRNTIYENHPQNGKFRTDCNFGSFQTAIENLEAALPHGC